MKKTPLLICAMTVVSWHICVAQFIVGIGDTNNQVAYSVQHTSTVGGYITAGYISNTAPIGGLSDANVTKTDASGVPLWSQVIGGPSFDQFNSIREGVVPTGSTAYVAAGYSASFSSGGPDMYLVGMNVLGVPLFSHIYGGASTEEAKCVQPAPAFGSFPDGYVMAGYTTSFSTFIPGTNIYAVRTDIAGGVVSTRVIGTPQRDVAHWIEPMRNGDFVIAGLTTGGCTGSQNIYVIRVDPALNPVWSTIIDVDSATDVAYCARENPIDGSIIITGQTTGVTNTADAFLLNLDAAGAFKWMQLYDLGGTESGQCVMFTTDLANNPQYIVSGYTNANSTSNQNALMFKTDLTGIPLAARVRTYGGPRDDVGYELDEVINSTGLPLNYILTGQELSFSAGQNDILLIETNNAGNASSICQAGPSITNINITPRCITSAVIFTAEGNDVTVTSPHTRIIYQSQACATPSPLSVISSEPLPLTASLPDAISIGPNPTNAIIEITFDETFNESTLAILNDKGTTVHTQVLKGTAASVDMRALSTGLYIARVTKTDGTVISLRIVKQ